MDEQRFEGVGRTLDEAFANAVTKIPPRTGRDFSVGRAVEVGVQRGGLIDNLLYYAVVVEDQQAPARTVGKDSAT
jgi:hypothetical protein